MTNVFTWHRPLVPTADVWSTKADCGALHPPLIIWKYSTRNRQLFTAKGRQVNAKERNRVELIFE